MGDDLGPIRDLAPGTGGWTYPPALLITDDGPALDPDAVVYGSPDPMASLRVERHGNHWAFEKSLCRQHPFRRSARDDLIPAANLDPSDGDFADEDEEMGDIEDEDDDT